jgi:tetratricopeptide (TPR) repeat protein
MGRFRDAIADLQKSAELDPLDTNTIQELGDTYMCLREWDEAERYIRRAVELAPNSALQSYYLLMLAYAGGDLDQARKVLSTMPPDDVLLPEANLLNAYMTRDLDRVVEWTSKMTRPAVVFPTAYRPREDYAARLNWLMGNGEAARAGFARCRNHLIELLEQRPREARLYAALCAAEAGLGNREASEQAREKCMEVAEPDLYGDHQYYYKFFEAAVLLGDTDDALNRLEEILSRPAEMLHPGYMKIDPMCDPLRDHPRFDEIIGKHENEKF